MKYRILLCLSSYKRPHLTAFQITRLLALDPPLDISASIKGISEYEFRRVFCNEWKQALDSGRLKLAFHPNRGQVHNVLDPMRDQANNYDLFVKIDDDDYYLDRYFQELSAFYDKLPVLPGLTNAPDITAFVQTQKGFLYGKDFHIPQASGPTLVLSRFFLKTLLCREKEGLFCDQNEPEDSLWVKLAREDNNLLHRPASRPGCQALIYNTLTLSCTRGPFLPEDQKKEYKETPSSTKEEFYLYLFTPQGGRTFRIFGNTAFACDTRQEYAVEFFHEDQLVILDAERKRKFYLKKMDGAFYPYSKDSLSESFSRPAYANGRIPKHQ